MLDIDKHTYHHPLLQVAAHPFQHLRGTNQFGYVQFEVGGGPSKAFHGRVAERPFLGMQASRISDLSEVHKK